MSLSSPSRSPTFGDYAVQNPEPPLEDQPTGPGQAANIRYTTEDATLVPRAVGAVIQEGAEQYRELCELLVAQDEFAGRDFSWGDLQIAECAAGIGDPGWQNQWRGAGLHTTCATSWSSSPELGDREALRRNPSPSRVALQQSKTHHLLEHLQVK